MLYFAYGSNLSVRRIQARASSAKVYGTFYLQEFELLFHKRGRDGSGKCDAFFTGRKEDVTYGRVYEISPADKDSLDHCEGLGRGYETKEVLIRNTAGKTCSAFTYVATDIASKLVPFCWYREHVLVGAIEAMFPRSYIEKTITVSCRRDPDQDRRKKELSIYT